MAELYFDAFRFDTVGLSLWRAADAVALTPKASAVLQCLLQRAGQLVSKNELLDAVWPDTAVSDASLKVCVQEIRRALGDRVEAPRFIATEHRRGYRFIGALAAPAGEPLRAPPVLSGRAAELAALQAAWGRARDGARQTVFVTGELGIGKTALVEAFLAGLAADDATIAHGRCLEQFAAGEAYLPLLEAFGRLSRTPGGAGLGALLHRHAPTWLAQMPGLVDAAELDALQGAIFAGTGARMLREGVEALEALAAARPLVLALEDLQWSDPSTLDVLALLAQRRAGARVLILATYRPVDAIVSGHPVKGLKQRLTQQRQCEEIALGCLAEADVAAGLTLRLGGPAPPGLAAVLHRRTDGHPLFVGTVVDALLADGRLVAGSGGWVLHGGLDAIEAGVPDGLRDMVEQQIERCAAGDVALLEVAALGRAEFSAALVAAALDADVATVEADCDRLAAPAQWIAAAGSAELPDGTVSGAYRFTHELYRTVLAARVPAARGGRLHRRIGEWMERVQGARADEVAAALAHHFEAAGDLARAVRYLRASARTAAARYANREAIAALCRAADLIERLPAGEQTALRRGMLQQRGVIYRAMGDVAAALVDLDAWAADARASGDAAEETRALLTLSAAASLIDRGRCLAVAEEAVGRSQAAGDPHLERRARGFRAYWWARIRGWRAADAEDVGTALADVRQQGHPSLLASHLAMQAYFLNLRADYTDATRTAAEGAALAQRGGDGFTYALCQHQRCWGLLHAGAWGEMLAVLAAALQVAARNQHGLWTLVFELQVAWCALEAGAIDVAAARSADSVATARAARHEYGTALALMVSARVHQAAGDTAAADADYAALDALADERPAAMEWVLRMPLHIGRSATALARGARDEATRAAAAACDLGATSGERTYLALGHCAAAHAAPTRTAAKAALASATALIANGRAPLAEWAVYDATAQPAKAAAARARLAASLDGAEGAAAALHLPLDALRDALRR